ncbi:hypothetical protein [Pseudoxanthomonas dokdonensis]|nr:hypothetical protein [Pseudoxanthomonas dokdonensis]
MDKPTRGTQWMLLFGGCLLFLMGGSASLRWLATGIPLFKLRGITYTGMYAAIPIIGFTLLGGALIVTSTCNLRPWR